MKLRYAIILLFIMILLHFFSVSQGLYSGEVIWIDKVLHVMAGIAYGIFWIWLVEFKKARMSQGKILLSTVLFVALIAILWEATEFIFLSLFPEQAFLYKIYSPTILESGSDILFNILGSIFLIVYIKVRTNANLLRKARI